MDTPGNKVIAGSDSCGSPCSAGALRFSLLTPQQRGPVEIRMQTFKHETNLSSLLLLKTVQRESRFPDSWSLYMNQEVERSEEEIDSTHQ